MASKVPDDKMDYSVVLTPLRRLRGEVVFRGNSVDIARGMLKADQMTWIINELLRQRRAYLFNRETKIRTMEYKISVKKNN